ncbi:TIGR04283 family arsenosugar biosynthesis glycosyltransferase [Aquibaculum sediminis]|uniref:TIGR04283 family arsenosugar biosynthesis glycosyltransferase n=1 Tax=Aquibaculum sediminis TaxID=3231907 RepID=UPI0034515911
MAGDAPRLAIVIPALNAAASLPATLESLRKDWPAAEIAVETIVVDGGSNDGTPAIAESFGCRCLNSPAGRGRQLSAGAQAAITTGAEWLFFLHADSRPTGPWVEALRRFMGNPANRRRAGYLRLRFDCPAPQARRVERLATWRAAWLGLPYGDQGLVIAAAFYQDLGGYPDWPLMEDVALVRRIGRKRLVALPATISTSAQRYEREGWWRRPWRNLTCLGLYFLGVPPERLVQRYERRRGTPP